MTGKLSHDTSKEAGEHYGRAVYVCWRSLPEHMVKQLAEKEAHYWQRKYPGLNTEQFRDGAVSAYALSSQVGE